MLKSSAHQMGPLQPVCPCGFPLELPAREAIH